MSELPSLSAVLAIAGALPAKCLSGRSPIIATKLDNAARKLEIIGLSWRSNSSKEQRPNQSFERTRTGGARMQALTRSGAPVRAAQFQR
jgi:hypothetical protein